MRALTPLRVGVSIVVALGTIGPATAHAAPVVTKFSTGFHGQPRAIAPGPEGSLWFAEWNDRRALAVGRITTRGAVTEFVDSSSPGLLSSGLTAGPDGNLWVSVFDGLGSPGDQGAWIARMTPAGAFTLYPISAPAGAPTVGPDGNLWFTESARIGRITPSGVVTEFPLPPEGSRRVSSGITVGGDGNLWFGVFDNETAESGVARITPGGLITVFPGPLVVSITAGSDGNLWFTGPGADAEALKPPSLGVGRLTLKGATKVFSTRKPTVGSSRGYLGAITRGPDGNVWFADPQDATQGRVGRVTPSGAVTEFALGPAFVPPRGGSSAPADIAAGPDGSLWVTDINQRVIWRMSHLGSGFTIGAVQGTTLSTLVSARGTVRVTDAAARSSRASISKTTLLLRPSGATGGPGTLRIKLKLTGAGSARLRRNGRLVVRARVTFKPASGHTASRVKTLVLTRS
jgi:streptogramin lyase